MFQWIEHPPDVQEVMGLIPVGDLYNGCVMLNYFVCQLLLKLNWLAKLGFGYKH